METPSIFQRKLTSGSTLDQNCFDEDCPELYPPICNRIKSSSKKSAKYIIKPREKSPKENNKNKAKLQKGRSVMPYNPNSNTENNETWNRDWDSNRAGTIREDPADSLTKIVNRNKATRESQKKGKQQAVVKIARCKKCKRLSYIENGICYYCNQQSEESLSLKSFIFGTALCCCIYLWK